MGLFTIDESKNNNEIKICKGFNVNVGIFFFFFFQSVYVHCYCLYMLSETCKCSAVIMVIHVAQNKFDVDSRAIPVLFVFSRLFGLFWVVVTET